MEGRIINGLKFSPLSPLVSQPFSLIIKLMEHRTNVSGISETFVTNTCKKSSRLPEIPEIPIENVKNRNVAIKCTI